MYWDMQFRYSEGILLSFEGSGNCCVVASINLSLSSVVQFLLFGCVSRDGCGFRGVPYGKDQEGKDVWPDDEVQPW